MRDIDLTLSLDEELIRKVGKIAVEEAASGRKRREREALERSFDSFQFNVGKRTWKREDLYAR